MKNMRKMRLRVCAIFALMVSVVFSSSMVSVTSAVSSTTIIVDGYLGDWAGVDPIVTDATGDAPSNEDITVCYVTNDGSNLYFMVQVSGSIGYVEGEVKPPYIVGLDVDQALGTGGVFGDIGVDYLVVGPYYMGPEAPLGMEYVSIIAKWVDGDPEFVGLSKASFSGGVLEFSCPLSVIGYPGAMDMLFEAEIVAETDWAPDTGHVTYVVDLPSILADGDPGDWVGIAPVVTDDTGEAGVVDNEDIHFGYAVADGETLYLRIDLVEGGLFEAGPTMVAVCLDTDCNLATGISILPETDISLGIGADYIVFWPWGPPGGPLITMPPMVYHCLTEEEFEFVGAVSGQPSGNVMEMAVPLLWIGDPDEIDMVFGASMLPGTDLTDPVHFVVSPLPPVPPSVPEVPSGTDLALLAALACAPLLWKGKRRLF